MKPAYSEAAERAVIGSILLKPELYYDVFLKADEFYVPDLRDMYEAITDIVFCDGGVVDPISVASKTKRRLSTEQVAATMKAAADPERIEYYANQVREASLDRQVRLAAQGILKSGESGNALLAEGQQAFMNLGSGSTPDEAYPVGTVSAAVLEEAERRRMGKVPKLREVVTGVPPIDDFMSLRRGDVVCLAGRPSMGKSAAMLWMVQRFIERGERVVLFSTETSKEQVAERLQSIFTGISSRRIGSKPLASDEILALRTANEQIAELPLWVDDQRHNVMHIAREIRRLKMRENITMAVIDHLQELKSGDRRIRGNERSEINAILVALRSVTREDPRTTLVLISQLNRGVESREDKRPMLSDLRESGKIEEIADLVFLLYRPFYYKPDANKTDLQAAVAKNRNGPTGRICMEWNYDRGQVGGVRDEFNHLWTVDIERGLLKDGNPTAQQTTTQGYQPEQEPLL